MAPTLTARDSVRLHRYLSIPTLLGGFVAPTPAFVPRLVRRRKTARAVHFLRGIRDKYGSRAWFLFPFAWTLLVLDGDGIEEVLASHDTVADPWAKRRLLSRFTPDGVIVSRDPEWRTRRPFNDVALAFGQQAHPDGDTFVHVVKDEVLRLVERRPGLLTWRDFSELADRVSQQVIFGRGQFDARLASHLRRLIAGSNWAIRRSRDFRPVHQHLAAALDRRPPGQACLAQRSADWLSEHGATRCIVEAPSQMAFWWFVIVDALARDVPRTLALIASAPDAVRRRLREEIPVHSALTAASIRELRFLDACIKEQLRLWTAVPLLARVAVHDWTLRDGTTVRAGQQVLMHAGFYHRDREVFGAGADRFDPASRDHDDVSGTESVTQSTPPLYHIQPPPAVVRRPVSRHVPPQDDVGQPADAGEHDPGRAIARD